MRIITSHNAQIPPLPIEENGDIRVWFAMRELLFTTTAPANYYVVEDENISRAKIITFLENYNSVAVLSSQPKRAFEKFAEQMVWVEAAGGVVESDGGELLMIRLRERWDLPKGHIEVGESGRVAAVREVEEETGIVGEVVGDEPLGVTWHAYDTYGRWELKRTEWWQMRAIGGALKPQTDEGISVARWCDKSTVNDCMKETYDTIKSVVAALHSKH